MVFSEHDPAVMPRNPSIHKAAHRRPVQDQVHQCANIDRGGTCETLPLALLSLVIGSC